jgi:hypothetical protein
MANVIGNSGSVKIGANAVAEVLNFSITETAAVADDTVIGDTYRGHKPGTKSWSGSVSCYWDKSDSNGQESMNVGSSVELHLIPEGAGAGNIDFNGTATIVSIERSVANDAIVTANFSFTGNGTLTQSPLV